jgi:DNA-binding LacI/PurR family transcriptional regulator
VATIADVAKQAGVARSTVSQALSGNRPVSPEMRERILRVVAELDYRPNATASSLRSRRTRTVGLSIPIEMPGRVFAHSPFSHFFESIADNLSLLGYKLLCLVSRSPEASELVRLAREGHMDGLLLLQIRLKDPRVAALKSGGLPFVAMGRSANNRQIVCVDTDLGAAADLAVRHLLDAGHRRIAFLGDNPVYGYQHYALAGFKRAHQSQGLSLRREDLLPYDHATDIGTALQPFLDRDRGPTALLTTADLDAVTALHFFSDHDLKVPDDVAIVTLGDSDLTQLARPAITTVFYSIEDYCRRSVEVLVDLIEGKKPPRQPELLPVTLIPRGSSAPPFSPERVVSSLRHASCARAR